METIMISTIASPVLLLRLMDSVQGIVPSMLRTSNTGASVYDDR